MGCIVNLDVEKGGRSKVEVHGRMMIIHLREDLDHHNAMYIRELTDVYLEKYAIKRILFDFSGVEFMDSSGIGVVMGRYKQMSYLGGEVYVWGVGKTVDRIFQMSGLYKLVKYWEGKTDAEFM